MPLLTLQTSSLSYVHQKFHYFKPTGESKGLSLSEKACIFPLYLKKKDFIEGRFLGYSCFL